MTQMHADPGSSSSTPPLRLVVVDADDRVRETLTRLLEIGDRVEIVGAAGEARLALEIVEATAPDIVVVDPRLPEIESGLAFISRLRAVAPTVRVVVMGGSDTPQLDDLTSAADCVCRKTFRAGDLLTAILAGAVARP
jgi:DNA-binding NarL/FixJ family response regulator